MTNKEKRDEYISAMMYKKREENGWGDAEAIEADDGKLSYSEIVERAKGIIPVPTDNNECDGLAHKIWEISSQALSFVVAENLYDIISSAYRLYPIE